MVDFGISRVLKDNTRVRCSSQLACTPAYTAPERFNPGTVDLLVADVYSYGMLLFYLWTGEPPYLGMSVEEIVWTASASGGGLYAQEMPDIDITAAIFIEMCTCPIPEERPTFEEAVLIIDEWSGADGGRVAAGWAPSSRVTSNALRTRWITTSHRLSSRLSMMPSSVGGSFGGASQQASVNSYLTSPSNAAMQDTGRY